MSMIWSDERDSNYNSNYNQDNIKSLNFNLGVKDDFNIKKKEAEIDLFNETQPLDPKLVEELKKH